MAIISILPHLLTSFSRRSSRTQCSRHRNQNPIAKLNLVLLWRWAVILRLCRQCCKCKVFHFAAFQFREQESRHRHRQRSIYILAHCPCPCSYFPFYLLKILTSFTLVYDHNRLSPSSLLL